MSDKQDKPVKKSTKIELMQRVTEVQDLLLQGYTRSHIVQYGSKWSISDRQIDDYISMANARVREAVQADTASDVAIIIRNLWDIINKNKQLNPQVARQALMDIAKLRGLEQSTVNHVFKRDEDLAKLTDEEFDKAIEQAANERTDH